MVPLPGRACEWPCTFNLIIETDPEPNRRYLYRSQCRETTQHHWNASRLCELYLCFEHGCPSIQRFHEERSWR